MTAPALACDLLDSPALRTHLPGLAMALDPDGMRARVQTLLVEPTHNVEECVPGKASYRGEEGCDVRYALRLRDRASGELVGVTVLGRVLADAEQAEHYLRTRIDPLTPVMPRSRPLRVAACVPDLGLVMYAFPLDPTLPTLVAATHPASVLPELRARLGWTAPDCTVQVVRHARGGWCVLCYAYGESHLVYGKVYADAAGPRRQDLLAALHRAVSSDVRVPRPLGYVPRIRMSLCDVVPGRAARLADARERISGVVAAARTASVLHAAPVVPPTSRTFAADVTALRRQLIAIRPVWPDVVAQLIAALTDVYAQAKHAPALPPTFCHGDFTPAQVLIDQTGFGVVDFDAAAVAEPALDLGRFLAYLRFALAKTGSQVGPALAQAFLSAYAEAAGHRSRDVVAFNSRVALYERLSLLSLATHACLHLKTGRLRTALALLYQSYQEV
jgi:aminoglycoside phosphotransferase (APT) family kinase protein